MKQLGFTSGIYNPCTFGHAERELNVLVHGDDFVAVGPRTQVLWFKKKLKMKFEIKANILGTSQDELKEARVLNRVIRVGEARWEYEADERHA